MIAPVELAPVDPGAPAHPVGDVPFWAETHQALAADPAHRAWYVLVDGAVVGLIGASSSDGRRAQVGYGVTPSHEGRGVASAALRALLEQLRREGCTTVVADTFVDHGASRRVLEKAGFEPVSTAAREVDGEVRQVVVYERALAAPADDDTGLRRLLRPITGWWRSGRAGVDPADTRLWGSGRHGGA